MPSVNSGKDGESDAPGLPYKEPGAVKGDKKTKAMNDPHDIWQMTQINSERRHTAKETLLRRHSEVGETR